MAAANPSLLHAPVLPKTDAVEGGEVEIGSVATLSANEFGPEANVVLHPSRQAQMIGVAADFSHVVRKRRQKIGNIRFG